MAIAAAELEPAERAALPRHAWSTVLAWILTAIWLPLLLLAIAAPIAERVVLSETMPWTVPLAKTGLLNFSASFFPYSAEAKASGFAQGDEVIAIDGHPLTEAETKGFPAPVLTLLRGPEGSIVTLTTRSPDGAVKVHRLTRSSAHIDELFTGTVISRPVAELYVTFMSLIGAAGLVTASAFLFLKARRKPVPLLLSFSLLLLALTWWAVPFWIEWNLMPWRIFALVLGWLLFVLAVMLFPDGRFGQRWMRWVAIPYVLFNAYGLLSIALPRWFPDLSSAFTGQILTALALLAALVSLILRYRALPPGAERQQIRWALLGFFAAGLIMTAGVTLETMIIPKIVVPSAWLWAVMLDLLLFVSLGAAVAAGLVISLLRFRLYDAESVISRSISIGALTVAFLAVFAGTEKVIELLGEEWFGERLGVLAGGIGAALAAIMLVPLHHRLSHWAEHKFQKQLIRLKHGLPLLVGDMRETAPVARIAAATLDSVGHGVRSTRSALVFEGALIDARGIEAEQVEDWRKAWTPALHDGFDIDKADALFPLRVPLAADGHGRIGWLLLGPRPDGSLYGKDERETLEQIADPVARALEIAAAREKREAEEAQRWRTQESLNAEIKAVNGELIRILGSLDAKLGLLVPLPPAAAAE